MIDEEKVSEIVSEIADAELQEAYIRFLVQTSAAGLNAEAATAAFGAELERHAHVLRTALHTLKPGEAPAPMGELGFDLVPRFLEATRLYELGERL